MHRELRPGHQRGQREHLVSIAAYFGAPKETGFGLRDFTIALHLVKKLLRRFLVNLSGRVGRDERVGSVGANELLPVLLQQLGAVEDVSPGEVAMDGDDYAFGAGLP